MVYSEDARGKWELIEDEALKERIVAALRKHWHEYHYGWALKPEE
ncbi:MAG: hypothetical protein V3R83_00360 [Gammaproteobacteria bacterium]